MTWNTTNDLTSFAIAKFQALLNSVKAMLPIATKLMLQTTAMGCLIDVITWALWVLVLGTGWLFGKSFYCRHVKEWWENGFEPVAVVGAILLGAGGLVFLIALFSFPLWSLMGIWHPDLYLVHQIIVRATEPHQS